MNKLERLMVLRFNTKILYCKAFAYFIEGLFAFNDLNTYYFV